MTLSSTTKLLLETIAKTRLSASQIAKITNLSLPYVSTQLAILEAKGFIVKEEQRMKKTGKPPKVFRLAKSIIELTCITEGCGKTTVFNDSYMKTYFQILSFIPPTFQHLFSEYFWTMKEDEKHILARGLTSVGKDSIEFIALTNKEELEKLRKKISHFERKEEHLTKRIVCWVHTHEELIEGVKNNDAYYIDLVKKIKPMVDPQNLFGSVKNE